MDRPTFSPSLLHFTATLQNDQMIEIWKVHALCPVFRLLHDTIVPSRHLVKLIVFALSCLEGHREQDPVVLISG